MNSDPLQMLLCKKYYWSWVAAYEIHKAYDNHNKWRRLAKTKNDYNWNKMKLMLVIFPIASNNLSSTLALKNV